MSPSTQRSHRVRSVVRDRNRPHADPDVLVLEDVARILRCDIDTVRRIPRIVLKARKGPGRQRLYLRSDVLAYIAGLPVAGLREEDDLPVAIVPPGRVSAFDPGLMARSLGRAGNA